MVFRSLVAGSVLVLSTGLFAFVVYSYNSHYEAEEQAGVRQKSLLGPEYPGIYRNNDYNQSIVFFK